MFKCSRFHFGVCLLAAASFILLSAPSAEAQLSGTYSIPGSAPTGYATIEAAIAALNTSGVGGAVTFNVAAGHTETFVSATAGMITATGTSTNTITFQKAGSGTNPLITAPVGAGTSDGIIEIAGGDYITFDGIDVQENSLNTASTQYMEWGYGVFSASATNGAKNNTIRNCSITLNPASTCYGIRQYQGLATSTSSTTPSAASGVNDDNAYYLNTITNARYGIYIYGYSSSWYGTGNTVGIGGGNTITGFGDGGTGYGIYTYYQNDSQIANNNLSTAATTTVYGIYTNTSSGANVNIYNNTVSISSSTTMYLIRNVAGSSGSTNSVNIYNNTLQNSSCSGSSTVYGIYNTGTPPTLNIYGNTLSNISSGSSVYGIYNSGAAVGASNWYNNTVNNLSSTGTGTIYGIYHVVSSSTSPTKTYGNTVHNLSTGGTTVYGITVGSGVTHEVYKNRIYNLTTTSTSSTPSIRGIYVSSATSTTIYNNYISDITAPSVGSATAPDVCGIYNNASSGDVNLYYNTVYLDASSSVSAFSSAAVYNNTGSNSTMRNNVFVNTSSPGTGFTVAHWRSSTTLTTYSTASNKNCYYAGMPGVNNLIYYDGTNSDQTLAAWQTRANPADGVSFTELPPFLNTTTKPYNLHLSATTATGCESGGTALTGFDDDYDGDTRYGSTGYTGAGVAPDVGADEGNFTAQGCSGTPVGGTAVLTTMPLCAGSPAVLIVQGASSGSGIVYQWQESDDDGVTDPWSNAVGGSGATTTTYTSPNFTAAIYYRCVTTCTNSNQSTASTSAGLSSGTAGLSGAYTINSAAATGGTNYQSFADAISALTNRGVCGPVTFNVASGSGPYTERLSIPPITGVTATDTILFNGNGVTVRFQPTSSDYTIVDMAGCSYITLNNLNITGLDASYGVGVLLRNQAANNRISNCTIDLTTINSTSSYSAFIATSNSVSSLSSSGNNASDCEFRNNNCLGSANGPYYGISIYGASATPATGHVIAGNTMQMYYYGIRLYYTSSCQVVDNTIKDFYNYGMYLYYTTGAVIRGNDLHRPTRTAFTTTYGIYVYTSSTGNVVERNRIHNLFGGDPTATSTQYGIRVSENATSGTENLVKNNLLYDLNGEGTLYALYSSGNYSRFYHNTVSIDNTSSSSSSTTYGMYSSVTTAPGTEFLNNCVTISRGGTGTKYCIYVSSSSGQFTSNYNNLYLNAAAGTQNVGYKGAAYATLSQWQAQGYDANSVQANPLYKNPSGGDFEPQEAALNNAATNLSTAGCMCVLDDFTGAPRSTTPDIGAYEFTPMPMAYVSSTTTQTTTTPVVRGATNQQIIGVQIVTTGSGSPLSATSFTFNTNGSSSAADIAGARLFYTGTSPNFSTAMPVGAVVSNPSGTFVITGSQQLAAGTNHFWLTYDVSSSATINNVLDAECASLTVGTAQTPTVTAPAGSRLILGPLSGPYTVGTGGFFSDLNLAFSIIGQAGLGGNTTLNIISDITEPAMASLDEWTETPASSNYTLTIQPSGGARTVSGNFGSGAVIKLNGADRVIIDGLNTGGNSLAIINTSTTTQAGIWLRSLGTSSGCNSVTIRNCTISCGSNTVASFGILANGSTTVTTTVSSSDNDNLAIQNNTIKKSLYGIYVKASTPGFNNSLLITGNTIGSTSSADYIHYRGIDIQGAASPLISQNTITGVFDDRDGYRVSGIEIGSDVTNAAITRNAISNIKGLWYDASADDGNGAFGIKVTSTTNVTDLVIANNMIWDVLSAGYYDYKESQPYGIWLYGGNGVRIYFNSVYLSGTFSYAYSTSAACYINSTSVTGVDMRNNIFRNSISGPSGTASYAVYVPSGFVFSTINYNDYYASGTYGILGYYGANKTTLNDWRASSGQDAASLAVDPSFVSTGNLHIGSGSTPNQLESGGTVITGLGVDIDGDVRPGPASSTNGGAVRPDIGADEFDGAMLDLFPPEIAYTPLMNSPTGSSRSLPAFATITDVLGVNVSSGTRPRIYYKKSTDANTYVGNTSTDNGWKWTEASNTASPFNFTIDYSLINGGSVSTGDVIQYFVVAQDVAATPNVGVNTGTFNSAPTSVALTSGNFPIGGAINSYSVAGYLSGTISVGSGQTFTSLTGAGGFFELINKSILSGDVTASITTDLTEDGTNSLKPWAESGTGNWRIQIQPSSAATRTISGSVAGSMIRIDGASRLTIDGSSGTGRYLVFRNTNTMYPTLELLNNATYNRVLNSVIEGGNTDAASGVVLFGTASAGNSNNAIIGCEIRDRSDAASVPVNLVHSLAASNSADTLKNNLMHDFTGYGVSIPTAGSGDNWRILSNGFYQTASRSASSRAISLLAGNGHAITANNIGGSAADRSGSPWLTTSSMYGIYLAPGTTSQTQVSQNIIGNIQSSGFYGVYCTGGDVSIAGNRIGHSSASSDTIFVSGSTYGIYNSGAAIFTAANDTIGYITGSSLLYLLYSTTGDNTFTGNLITHISGGSTTYGMYVSGSGTNLISGNTLNDVTTTSTFYGIYVPGTGTSAITGNTLSQLSTTSTMYAVYTSGSGAHTTASTNTVSGINSGSTTYVIYATGTTPTRVITNNTIQDVNLSQTGTSTLAGMYITATGTNIVTGNTIQRLAQKSSSATQTAALYGIYVTSGSWNSTLNNTIDSLVNRTCQGSTRGIYVSGGAGTRLSGNTISRLWSQNDETPPVMKKGSVGGMIANAGIDTLENNTVYSLHTAYDTTTTSTFTSAYGIDLASSSVNGIVRGNLIYDVINHNAGTKKTYTSLLLIEGTGNGTVVEKNRMYGLVTMGTGVSTGTPPDNAPPIASAVEISGAANAVYSNNQISVGDQIGNEAIVIGFDDLSTGSSTYYYNSVYVGGANSSGASRSAAYAREGASSVYATATLTNNLLYNKRSGGTGGHYAIMNSGGSTGWTSSDFNLLVSAAASTIGLWSTTDCNFATWKTQSGGDTYSLSTDAASLSSTRLFTSPGTADLSIVTSNPECWYVNGKGIAGAASGNIADDYGATSVRSTTLGFATDIGADEFNTSAIPPVATASGIPVANTTTYYSFAGQNLASITWGTSGTVPSVIEFRYYSGDNPPAPLTGNYGNAYANITQSSGTGFTYDITFGYSPAWLGTISSEANIRLAKRDGGVWSFLGTSVVNTSNKTVTQTGLTSFSDFTMSDATNPLPVELSAFNAQYRGTSVHLSWKTASELNTLRYEIQRRIAGDWEAIGSVDARGSADTPNEYSYEDSRLPKAERYLYRLKMIDRDGTFEYSREVLVQAFKPDGFRLFVNYPNPFNPSTTISFSLPAEQFVTVRVVDAAGREVEVLHSGMLPAGVYSSLFFARDLPSGVYTCIVTAGGEIRTQRMLLTR